MSSGGVKKIGLISSRACLDISDWQRSQRRHITTLINKAQQRMLRGIDRVQPDKPVLTAAQILELLVKNLGESENDV